MSVWLYTAGTPEAPDSSTAMNTSVLPEELEGMGILFEEHLACCQSCGRGAMEQREEEDDEDEDRLGFCFFHAQDTENAAETGVLWLAFDAYGDHDSAEVARLVVAAARKHGIDVRWCGNTNTRIELHGMDREYYRRLLEADQADMDSDTADEEDDTEAEEEMMLVAQTA